MSWTNALAPISRLSSSMSKLSVWCPGAAAPPAPDGADPMKKKAPGTALRKKEMSSEAIGHDGLQS